MLKLTVSVACAGHKRAEVKSDTNSQSPSARQLLLVSKNCSFKMNLLSNDEKLFLTLKLS